MELLEKIVNFGIGYLIVCGIFAAVIFIIAVVTFIRIAKHIKKEWKDW